MNLGNLGTHREIYNAIAAETRRDAILELVKTNRTMDTWRPMAWDREDYSGPECCNFFILWSSVSNMTVSLLAPPVLAILYFVQY